MSLIRFRYLDRRRITVLVVILTLTSTLFSVTAYSFIGFYNGFTGYVGEEKNVIAVYSKTGSTPFTGIVPLAAADKVASFAGVLAVSPEVIAPCMVNGHSVFMRGILPQELTEFNELTGSSSLDVNDTSSAIIGQGAAGKLNLKAGDTILAVSVLSERYIQLQIKGVFTTASSLNDEILTPLCAAQWLRGLSYNDVTLIRVKIDLNQTNSARLYQEISNQTQPTLASLSSSPTQKSHAQQQFEASVPLTQSSLGFSNVGVEESQQFMTSYLDRYGISRDTLSVLSIIVLLCACGTIICAITLFVKQHDSDVNVLRSIGVAAKKIKIDIAIRAFVWSLIATALGTVISAVLLVVFQKIGFLQVLSHTITFQLDPLIVVANIALVSLVATLTLVRMELNQ